MQGPLAQSPQPWHCVYYYPKTPADKHGLPLLRRLNCKWWKNADRFVDCIVCRRRKRRKGLQPQNNTCFMNQDPNKSPETTLVSEAKRVSMHLLCNNCLGRNFSCKRHFSDQGQCNTTVIGGIVGCHATWCNIDIIVLLTMWKWIWLVNHPKVVMKWNNYPKRLSS